MEFDKYRAPPINRSDMPSKRTSEANEINLGNGLLYLVAALAIMLAVYYIPDYFILEKLTSDHAAFVLGAAGVNAHSKVVGSIVLLDNIQIVKDCTGIQVLAVFLGLLIPLPNASIKKKLATLSVLFAVLYVANVLRIALEFWLVHFNVLPWILAHYPMSLMLGILGVFSLVIVTNRLLPEFGDFVFSVMQRASKLKLRT